MGRITRAVIEMSADITPLLPAMKRRIKGCAYNADGGIAGFRFRNMGIIVKSREIIVNNAEDEAPARALMAWLEETLAVGDALPEPDIVN